MSNHEGEFSADMGFVRPFSTERRRRPTQVEDISELIWQNGQVVSQSQNNRDSLRKTLSPVGTLSAGKFHQQNLYLPDDEMNMMLQSPWNQYSSFEGNEGFCSDFVFNPGGSPGDVTTANVSGIQNVDSLQMLPPSISYTEPAPAVCSNFPTARGTARLPLDRLVHGSIVRESTVVDSCASPSFRDPSAAGGSATFAAAANSHSTANHDAATWEIYPTSSTGGSSASAQLPRVSSPSPNRNTVDKPSPGKRKAEDAHAEKKAVRCTKRTRAAEVHNLSERRRRDRINEKMQELQELIPRCNKLDKASMLDEAIEYLKSLQLQVQMMAMGCGMLPMVFPGMQQFLPAVGMRTPIMPFSNVKPSPTPAAANATPRFTHPAFHYPPMAAQEPIFNNENLRSTNLVRIPTFADPFQPYLGQQVHLQNQTTMHANNGSKPSSSRPVDGRDKNQHGAAL